MTIEELKKRNCIVFECISGSRVHGLATAQSDLDIKGVFILPQNDYFGFYGVDQVNNETNDVVYFELRKFMDLLSKSNPGALELLYTPEQYVLFMHPVFAQIRKENVLSKACKNSFGLYAYTQIRKARGLNKKILNPMEKDRKGIPDFCYVPDLQGSITIHQFLKRNDLLMEECGLANIPHMPDVYGLYYGGAGFRGIVSRDTANDVAVSAIPQDMKPLTIMTFNRSGYSAYCKAYKAYWDWVDMRNEARFEETIRHGCNYDTKNLMHTLRLLQVCIEIGREGRLNVWRHDRAYLLRIKTGEFSYDELLCETNHMMADIEVAFENSPLPEQPDRCRLNELLITVREQFYQWADDPAV